LSRPLGGEPQTKLELQGPMFVVERTSSPRLQLVVFNRKSLTDFVIGLPEGSTVEQKPPLAIVSARVEVSAGRLCVEGSIA
jgi:hypothetical protein